MSGYLLKEWQDGKGGAWTYRIRWYAWPEGRVRLKIIGIDGELYPWFRSEAEAQALWDRFKANPAGVWTELTGREPKKGGAQCNQ